MNETLEMNSNQRDRDSGSEANALNVSGDSGKHYQTPPDHVSEEEKATTEQPDTDKSAKPKGPVLSQQTQ